MRNAFTPKVLQRSVVFDPQGVLRALPAQGIFGIVWTHFGCDDLGRGHSWHLVGRGQSDSGRTDPTTNELSGPKCQQCCRREKHALIISVSVGFTCPLHGREGSNPVCQIMGQLLRHINKQAGSLGSRRFKTKSQAVYFLWSHPPPDAASLPSRGLLLTPAVKSRSRVSLRKTADEGGACLSLVSVSVDSKSARYVLLPYTEVVSLPGFRFGEGGVHEPLSKPLSIIQFYRMMRIG